MYGQFFYTSQKTLAKKSEHGLKLQRRAKRHSERFVSFAESVIYVVSVKRNY